MTDSKRAPSESEENVHRHATPVDDSPGAASEPDTTALPAAGSVVRAHGRLWHSKADFWHTSLGDVPKKWADLAAAPDLSPVVPVDDVCDWLDSRLVPEAVAFRAEFGGWDQ